ncbi:8779_t:CDS:2, partial [Funneliformis geosporum]
MSEMGFNRVNLDNYLLATSDTISTVGLSSPGPTSRTAPPGLSKELQNEERNNEEDIIKENTTEKGTAKKESRKIEIEAIKLLDLEMNHSIGKNYEKFTSQEFRKKLIDWTVIDDQPFIVIKEKKFIDMLTYLKFDLNLPSADTLRYDLVANFIQIKNNVYKNY